AGGRLPQFQLEITGVYHQVPGPAQRHHLIRDQRIEAVQGMVEQVAWEVAAVRLFEEGHRRSPSLVTKLETPGTSPPLFFLRGSLGGGGAPRDPSGNVRLRWGYSLRQPRKTGARKVGFVDESQGVVAPGGRWKARCPLFLPLPRLNPRQQPLEV